MADIMPGLWWDPMLIHYLLVLPDEEMEDFSPMQGFSHGWFDLAWALELLATLPADVLERAHPLERVIAQRIGGVRQLWWRPVNLSALLQITADVLPPFVVVFSGDRETRAAVEIWRLGKTALHVSAGMVVGDDPVEEFDVDVLQRHCLAALASKGDMLTPARKRAAETLIPGWKHEAVEVPGLKNLGHNIFTPNRLSLERAGRKLPKAEPFVAMNEEQYTSAVLSGVAAVMEVRKAIGVKPLHVMTLIQPALILSEPSMYRHAYRNRKPGRTDEERAADVVMKFLRKQTGLHSTKNALKLAESLERSDLAKAVLSTRQYELTTQTLGVAVFAAQTTSAVMRMSPGVNHLQVELSEFARSIRSENPHSKRKAGRLFGAIQAKMSRAVGERRLEAIGQQSANIKIVSDAPLEWLPIGNLPLSLRLDCSRINSTPGNILMGQLVRPPIVTLPPSALTKILVVSSFENTDPLRDLLTQSIMGLRHLWQDAVEVQFRRVDTVNRFVDVINDFDGTILIFDGHGVGNHVGPVGALRIGREDVDVWSLRGRVRIPPIVILSACDTHGIDSSSHATVGNGFLAIGARTVLATMLPVGGAASGSFMARLFHRLAKFIPAVLKERQTTLDWSEVISGMLRMVLASELADALVGPSGDVRNDLLGRVNYAINTNRPDWFDLMLAHLVATKGWTREYAEARAADIIAGSESIRYVQLGNPETILIDDGSIRKRFVPNEEEIRRA